MYLLLAACWCSAITFCRVCKNAITQMWNRGVFYKNVQQQKCLFEDHFGTLCVCVCLYESYSAALLSFFNSCFVFFFIFGIISQITNSNSQMQSSEAWAAIKTEGLPRQSSRGSAQKGCCNSVFPVWFQFFALTL